MYQVLLICKDNVLLSPLAGEYLKMFTNNLAKIYSAGIEPKKISSVAIKILKDEGIDISGMKTHSVSEFKHIDFDYILTFDAESEEFSHHFPSKTVKYHYDFNNLLPEENSDKISEETYKAIREKIKKILRSFVKDHFTGAKVV